MRRLLITGGAGFIGTNFTHYWADKYPEDKIIVLDVLTYAGNRANIAKLEADSRIKFVQGNICEQELVISILTNNRIDTIVHFAAESHVDRSIIEPNCFIQTNIVGTHTLLYAAREMWLGRDNSPSNHLFHHVSTDEVYGTLDLSDPACSERSPYAPNSPYAASKAASDHLIRSYHRTYGLNVTTSTCSNNYGPFQFPEKLIPLVIANALKGEVLPVYGDGSNRRDWLYVTDHCQGIDLIINKGLAGETYNIGGDTERANIDVVKQICAEIDNFFDSRSELKKTFPDAPAAKGNETESLIRFVKDRPGHDWRYALDITKSMNELTYAPQEDLHSGLVRTIDWMIDNVSWWK